MTACVDATRVPRRGSGSVGAPGRGGWIDAGPAPRRDGKCCWVGLGAGRRSLAPRRYTVQPLIVGRETVETTSDAAPSALRRSGMLRYRAPAASTYATHASHAPTQRHRTTPLSHTHTHTHTPQKTKKMMSGVPVGGPARPRVERRRVLGHLHLWSWSRRLASTRLCAFSSRRVSPPRRAVYAARSTAVAATDDRGHLQRPARKEDPSQVQP